MHSFFFFLFLLSFFERKKWRMKSRREEERKEEEWRNRSIGGWWWWLPFFRSWTRVTKSFLKTNGDPLSLSFFSSFFLSPPFSYFFQWERNLILWNLFKMDTKTHFIILPHRLLFRFLSPLLSPSHSFIRYLSECGKEKKKERNRESIHWDSSSSDGRSSHSCCFFFLPHLNCKQICFEWFKKMEKSLKWKEFSSIYFLVQILVFFSTEKWPEKWPVWCSWYFPLSRLFSN